MQCLVTLSPKQSKTKLQNWDEKNIIVEFLFFWREAKHVLASCISTWAIFFFVPSAFIVQNLTSQCGHFKIEVAEFSKYFCLIGIVGT